MLYRRRMMKTSASAVRNQTTALRRAPIDGGCGFGLGAAVAAAARFSRMGAERRRMSTAMATDDQGDGGALSATAMADLANTGMNIVVCMLC